MEDSELEEIRKQRLAQLQSQYNNVSTPLSTFYQRNAYNYI